MWNGMGAGDVLAHRYRILECIGEGGMGKVYIAEDTKLPGKRWAVKETVSAPYDDETSRKEVEMLLKLDHPQLPRLADYYHFADLGRTYLIMEYVKGRTIAGIVSEHGKIREDEVIRIGLALSDILHYLHSLKPEPIIHRDLKPGNVMLDERGEVRLIDFGISRTYKPHQLHDTVRFGSPGFLAPEQLMGMASDARTDIYQLGALMNYMLSGGRRLAEPLQPEDGGGAGEISPGLHGLLARMLSARPEDRPASAAIVREELLALRAGTQADGGRGLIRPDDRSDGMKRGLGYIVVGSLYPGAGATRTACGLSEAIAGAGMSCAIVEYAPRPELAFKLGGVEAAPKDYVYLTDRVDDRSIAEWRQGRVFYYPMNPEVEASALPPDQWYRSLLFIRSDAVLIDVGSSWEDPFVWELARRADRVVCAVDSRLHKWFRRDVEQVVERLAGLQADSGRVHIAAYQTESGKPPWTLFPLPVDLRIPFFVGRFDPGGCYAELLGRWGVHAGRKRRRWRRLLQL